MGRNEIRFRRHSMNSGRIARHRNYDELMERHERNLKIRRYTRALMYFMITTVFITILLSVLLFIRWEKRQGVKKNKDSKTSSLIIRQNN